MTEPDQMAEFDAWYIGRFHIYPDWGSLKTQLMYAEWQRRHPKEAENG